MMFSLKLPDYSNITKNIKSNVFLIISGIFFSLLQITTFELLVSAIASSVFIIYICCCNNDLFNALSYRNNLVKLLILISCVGICINLIIFFNSCWSNWDKSIKLVQIINQLNINHNSVLPIIKILSIIFGVISSAFIYLCLCYFWKRIISLFNELNVTKEIEKKQIIILIIIAIIACVFSIVCFSKSNIFYDSPKSYVDINNDKIEYDLIYTSDSPMLLENNAYMSITYSQNDLRQPLFAIFAAPFFGIAYVLGYIFNSHFLYSTICNCIQICLLIFSVFILSCLVSTDNTYRTIFIIICSLAYPFMLATIMMEQYIIAFFYLMLLICSIVKKYDGSFCLVGAGGTLLTSLAFAPFVVLKDGLSEIKKCIFNSFKLVIDFLLTMIAFCRLDVILSVFSRIAHLSKFSGIKLTFYEKLLQYLEFIHNCFISPNAGSSILNGYYSWQLTPVTNANIFGIVILILVIISFVVNRKKILSKICIYWIFMSFVLLVLLGWGTIENGLVLYVLYFYWAFVVLLFQLVECICYKLNNESTFKVLAVIFVGIMCIYNIPAILEIYKFAVYYYPVK